LQNRLTDLATLFHFLRVCPYDDPKTFDADITQVWKSHQETDAIGRLKRLLQCILLRRSKNSIELPSRVDKLYALDFSHEERSLYEESRTRAVRVLDNALSTQSGPSFRVSYMNALQRINDLRLICNLGVYKRSTSTHQISHDVNRTKCEWNTAAAQRMFDSVVTVENVSCFLCSLELDATDDDVLAGGPGDHSHLHFSRCLRIICSSCIQQFSELSHANRSLCGHVPQCPVIPVSRGSFSNNSSNVSSPRPSEFAQDQEELPTKVRALITDLQNLQKGVKR
jgi:SWI/SNF-related matrix-associated actin-dependent regulator of chromatin subfamily A3